MPFSPSTSDAPLLGVFGVFGVVLFLPLVLGAVAAVVGAVGLLGSRLAAILRRLVMRWDTALAVQSGWDVSQLCCSFLSLNVGRRLGSKGN